MSAPPSARDLRLFVAVELPEDVRRALAATVTALGRAGVAGDAVRWVRPEGIHVTLKFLGATAEAQVPAIEDALRAAVAGMRPFRVQPAGVGSFGGRRRLRVVWVGVEGDVDALAALAARVEQGLAPLGFPAEQRPFAAHLTLGRVRDETPPAVREDIFAAMEGLNTPPIPPVPVDRVSLMQSSLGPGGASYRALAVFPLQ